MCVNSQCMKKRVTPPQSHLNLEVEVPQDGSDLSYVIEQQLHQVSDCEGYHCELDDGGCGEVNTVPHRTSIYSTRDKFFIIVVLRRVVWDAFRRPNVNRNNVTATGDLQVTDKIGSVSLFEPIAVIEHWGGMTTGGSTQGHYVCDIKSRQERWYRTSDNSIPKEISKRKVSKQAAVVLYFKKH